MKCFSLYQALQYQTEPEFLGNQAHGRERSTLATRLLEQCERLRTMNGHPSRFQNAQGGSVDLFGIISRKRLELSSTGDHLLRLLYRSSLIYCYCIQELPMGSKISKRSQMAVSISGRTGLENNIVTTIFTKCFVTQPSTLVCTATPPPGARI